MEGVFFFIFLPAVTVHGLSRLLISSKKRCRNAEDLARDRDLWGSLLVVMLLILLVSSLVTFGSVSIVFSLLFFGTMVVITIGSAFFFQWMFEHVFRGQSGHNSPLQGSMFGKFDPGTGDTTELTGREIRKL